jgi:hypothetical protein
VATQLHGGAKVGARLRGDDQRRTTHKAGLLQPQAPATDRPTKPGVCWVISPDFCLFYLALAQLCCFGRAGTQPPHLGQAAHRARRRVSTRSA